MAIPLGMLNWAWAQPSDPHLTRKAPSAENTWTRSLLESATYGPIRSGGGPPEKGQYHRDRPDDTKPRTLPAPVTHGSATC